MPTPSAGPLRVAVLGASGIGKNHARWFHRHGCEVCAFLGSSQASVQATQDVLQDGFGFSGRGYHELEVLLREEKPDIVCISSPPAHHYQQALASFAHGAHVLCEKPLVYDPQLSSAQMVQQANHMVQAAAEAGVLFGTQTQYAVAVDTLLQLSGHHDASEVKSFAMEMETKNLKPGRDYEQIWIDLSPHPLSVLQILSAGGEIEQSSIQCEIREHESEARFRLWPSGIEAHIVVRFNPHQAPVRRFVLNGQSVDYSGRKDEHGEFWTYLTAADGREQKLPDFVDTLIANFIAACRGEQELAVPGTLGAQNVQWQWQLMDAAKVSKPA
jgi:predicted dehydrogenase